MAKRTDINKILVIGSGPIVIGQGAEFDYAGTQACLALKEEGYEVVLCNSNPATIMTDLTVADKVYMEPLTLEYAAKIVRRERPDAIVPGIGGQTGLNLAMQLEKKGILKECRTELLGTCSESIERAEDRKRFKQLCEELGEPVLASAIANTADEAVKAAEEIGGRTGMRLGAGAPVHVERYAELLERIFDYRVITVHYILGGDTLLAGLDGDRHAMLVAAADEQHFAALQAQIACVDVGRHVHSGQMAYVHRAVGIGESCSDESAFEFIVHEL